MQPLESEKRVIAAAEEHAATLDDNPNHTVAAAAMDVNGGVHVAVNAYHFTGGPCAELAVIALAATRNAGPLVAMAAAGDRGRGLIPPCGRCRQAMLDLHPDIVVAVPGDPDPEVFSVRDLLPHSYVFPDSTVTRVVRFNRRFVDEVTAGTKTTTVRWNDPIAVGPALLYFEDHPGPALHGEVLSVTAHPLRTLTPGDADLPPETDMTDYRAGLAATYPSMPEDAVVDVVRFRVTPNPAPQTPGRTRPRSHR